MLDFLLLRIHAKNPVALKRNTSHMGLPLFSVHGWVRPCVSTSRFILLFGPIDFPFLLHIWLSQWLTFELLGVTYLGGKTKFQILFCGPLAEYDIGCIRTWSYPSLYVFEYRSKFEDLSKVASSVVTSLQSNRWVQDHICDKAMWCLRGTYGKPFYFRTWCYVIQRWYTPEV